MTALTAATRATYSASKVERQISLMRLVRQVSKTSPSLMMYPSRDRAEFGEFEGSRPYRPASEVGVYPQFQVEGSIWLHNYAAVLGSLQVSKDGFHCRCMASFWVIHETSDGGNSLAYVGSGVI